MFRPGKVPVAQCLITQDGVKRGWRGPREDILSLLHHQPLLCRTQRCVCTPPGEGHGVRQGARGAGRAGQGRQGSSGTGHPHSRRHVPTAGELPRRSSAGAPQIQPCVQSTWGRWELAQPSGRVGGGSGVGVWGLQGGLDLVFPLGHPGNSPALLQLSREDICPCL